MAGFSRWTDRARLSSRNPSRIGCRMRPSAVHSWNRTSHTSFGSTHWTGALTFGRVLKGQAF